MIVTKRTKLSLCQILSLFEQDVIQILLEKHEVFSGGYDQVEIGDSLYRAGQNSIETLIGEIVRTKGDLRNKVSPRYRFDERWDDFERCLLIDGYRVENNEVVRIEPFIESIEPVEDDFIKELKASFLPSAEDIIKHINHSSDAFRKSTPDYNGCLSHSRLALETTVRAIAKHKGNVEDSKKWGKSLRYLQENAFVTPKEEKTIASIYTFVSDGSHIPIGFTEEEFVRFGRNLVTSICYFVVKKFNGKKNAQQAQLPTQ